MNSLGILHVSSHVGIVIIAHAQYIFISVVSRFVDGRTATSIPPPPPLSVTNLPHLLLLHLTTLARIFPNLKAGLSCVFWSCKVVVFVGIFKLIDVFYTEASVSQALYSQSKLQLTLQLDKQKTNAK